MIPNNFQNGVLPAQQNNSAIKHQIISNLRNQQCPPGWQQTYRIENRVGFVHEITTQLFLVKPEMSEQKTLEVALEFERDKFFGSLNEETYRSDCRAKLGDIYQARDNRRLQNQNPQGFISQQQMFPQPMINPSQFQQGVGGPPIQHLNQAQNMARIQQVHMHQQQMANVNAARMQQGIPLAQSAMNMSQQAPKTQGSQPFTPEENAHIQQRAQAMAVNLTDAQREDVARKVRNLPDQMKMQLDQQGVNLIQAYVNSQAAMQYRQEKARALAMQENQGLHTANGVGIQPQLTPQPSMPSQGLNPPQLNQTARVGNVNQQILAQQQEAVRRQQAGQVVVPGNPGHGGPRTQQTPQPQQQPLQQQQQQQQHPWRPKSTWPAQHQGAFQQHQQSLWNNSRGQQMPQTQAQAPTPNLAVAGQQSSLQGQVDGLNGNSSGRLAQQSPALPTLNQPMATPSQLHNGPSPRPSQSNTQNTQGVVQPGVNGQPRAPTSQNANLERFKNLPPMIQQQLARLPSDAARRHFMLTMQAKQQEMRQKQNAHAKIGNPQGAQNGTQFQQPGISGHMANNQHNQNNQGLNGQLVQGPNAAAQQPGPSGQMNRGGPQAPGQPPSHSPMTANLLINDEQTRFMDGIEFPRGILNNKSTLGRIPESAKTWGELKQFVSQNVRGLPEGTLQKLGELQAQAYHLNVVPQMNQQRQRMAQQNGNAAPTAQMLPGNQVQPQNVGFDVTGPSQMPTIPQPTIQDIQNVRNNLQGNAQGMSDDHIRSILMSKRQQAPANNVARNQQSLSQQQHIEHNKMLRAQQLQQTRNQTLPQTAQGQRQQQPSVPQNRQPSHKAPQANMSQSTTPSNAQARQTTGSRAVTQSNQKNLKRNNNNMNDDVVEIADPKLSKQAPTSKGVQSTQAPSGMPPFTQQQFDAMSSQQKAQYIAQRQRQAQAVQDSQIQAMQAKSNPDTAKQKQELEQANIKVRAILEEVRRSLGQRPSQPMSPKTRGSMIQKLRDSQPMAQRVEMALTFLFKMTGNEEKVREMARMHLLLREQVRDNDFTPIENFTVSAGELDQIIQKLKDQCAFVLSKVVPQQQRGNLYQQQPQNPSNKKVAGNAPNQQQVTGNTQPQKLTAESLQQQQEALQRSRAASLQKNQNNSNRPPAAPTTTHAPFSFGQQSPQGVPVIYNTKNELTQDKLVLPAAKKRKNNNQTSAASTPAQGVQTPGSLSSPFNRVESPELLRAPAPVSAPLVVRMKCTVPDCKSRSAFITQADLDKHMAEAHLPKEEEIKDPLAYCLEGFRLILNLDENGYAKPAEPTNTNNIQSAVMKKSVSAQGQNIKAETATPMSRNPTGAGPSPAANLLRTPQPSSTVKTPASETKSTGQATTTKRVALKGTETPNTDPWANAKVPKHWFSSVFSDVADLNRLVSTECVTNWLERNPFHLTTDDSSNSSKASPHVSDISANDDLNINLTGASTSNDWIPPDWLDDGLSGDLAASVLDPVLTMDWDTAFGSGEGAEGKEEAVEKNRKRDDADPSDEFLRAYAPEQLAERLKKEQERRR